jgi:hypothetical protein
VRAEREVGGVEKGITILIEKVLHFELLRFWSLELISRTIVRGAAAATGGERAMRTACRSGLCEV